MSSDLEDMVHQMIERKLRGVTYVINGLVSSYDPVNHKAKVLFQPGGQESGWMQIHTPHIGNGWGVATGLQVNDQVAVNYQYGDLESGAITGRVHSDTETPPTAQSGEMVLQHQSGSKLFLAADGSATLQDGKGASTKHDGAGNIAITATTFTVTATTINLAGKCNLGTGSPMVPAAKQGTIDTGGNADISNLATSVNVS